MRNPNLAGDQNRDEEVIRELTRAKITPIEIKKPYENDKEVPTNYMGVLGAFTFIRGWYYWRVKGPMPLVLAKELYEDPVGREDIRAGGDCTCPAPEKQAAFFDENGLELVSDPEGKDLASWKDLLSRHPQYKADFEKLRFVSKAEDFANISIVDSYHIDSELGLRIFAEKAMLVPLHLTVAQLKFFTK